MLYMYSTMKSMMVSNMNKMRMNKKKKNRSSEKHKVNVFFHEHLFLVCPCSVNSHLSFMKQSCEIDLIFQDGWSTIFTGHYKFRNDKRFPDVNGGALLIDRKSTCLNSSHVSISYAVFCLQKNI